MCNAPLLHLFNFIKCKKHLRSISSYQAIKKKKSHEPHLLGQINLSGLTNIKMKLFHFRQWSRSWENQQFQWTTRMSWAEKAQLKLVLRRTWSTYCLLSVFHTSTRNTFRTAGPQAWNAVNAVLFCKQSDWFLACACGGELISLIMEAVLPSVEKPPWQPDMMSCSSQESSSYTQPEHCL